MIPPPRNTEEAMIAAGGAALRRHMSILSRSQSEKLFAEALNYARIEEELSHAAWSDWFRRSAEEREAEQATTPHGVLGVSAAASTAEVNDAWRKLAAAHHPDRGGDAGKMAAINAARDAMLRSLRRAA